MVARFHDFAVVREAVEMSSCHLGVTNDALPFAKGQVGCGDDRCAFVALADEEERKQ